MTDILTCQVCDKTLTGKQKKFCSLECNRIYENRKNKEVLLKYKRRRLRRRRLSDGDYE